MSGVILSGAESPFDALRHIRPDGSEFWSARELMPFLGYGKWERFADAVEQAKGVIAAEDGALAADREASQHREAFGRTRQVGVNFHLSRRACYLTAMRGDSRKPEIRAALNYFAIKTREAEVRASAQVPQLSNRDLALMVIAESDRAEAAERKVKELEPSAQAWDTLAEAKGDFSLRDAAHVLNRDPGIATGQNRLLATLRELGMVDRNGVPYAKHAAHLTERPTSYKHPHTGEPTLGKPQVRITVRGLRYLHQRMGGVAPLRFEQLPISGDAA